MNEQNYTDNKVLSTRLADEVKHGWYKVGNDWEFWHYGNRVENDWYQDGEIWYYLGQNGKMHTGWLTYKKRRYYMDPSGAMQVGLTWIGDDPSGSIWYLFNQGQLGTSTDYGALLVAESDGVLSVFEC